ncbi:hypothetical protein [Streptomyces griseorubiginosus]|uniref:Uncharacterized protein n=1 Tax=Streptomyces griseorubiginosus TaxID=67304 RepID=A0AAI8L842_9ACTN|nr:hypothetical protein [Streptomyces griseorubiginosus]AYC43276.1 hypothetical protein DWG14_07583 [Streptomyces griseorubiginosus]
MTVPAPDPQRFHLTVSSSGRPVMHGWWSREATARDKFRDWIGAYGGMPAAHLLLAERTGDDERPVESWPVDAPPGHRAEAGRSGSGESGSPTGPPPRDRRPPTGGRTGPRRTA